MRFVTAAAIFLAIFIGGLILADALGAVRPPAAEIDVGPTPVDCRIEVGPNESIHPDNVLRASSDAGVTDWQGVEARPIETMAVYTVRAQGVLTVSIITGPDNLTSIPVAVICENPPRPSTTSSTIPPQSTTTSTTEAPPSTTVPPSTTSSTEPPPVTTVPPPPPPGLAITGVEAVQLLMIALALGAGGWLFLQGSKGL